MFFARRLLFVSIFIFLLAAVAPRIVPAPHTAIRSVQAQAARATQIAAQAYTLPPEKLAKAIVLSRIRNILGFAESLWGLVVLWLLLATRAAAALASRTERLVKQRWLQGLLFFAALLVILTLAGLPLSWYGHSVSLGYGISVEGWGSWLGDQAKVLGVSMLIGVPVMLLFHWMVRRWPRRYWLVIWLATLPLLVISVFAEPLLEPVFYKFEPLAKNHSALVAELEKVVARTGTNIPPERMFLMKASEKSNGLNAYVTGIGATKRIVVWDTTAGRIPDDEVLFIFGHESGHYVLNHIPKGIFCSAVFLFFFYWGCAGLAGWLARRYGAGWKVDSLASRAGFVVLLITVSTAQFYLEPIDNAFSRHIEHQADVYGQEAIHGIVADPQKTAVAAFNDLGAAWLDDPNPNSFIEFWSYNHPSTQRRANFAAHYDPWVNGGRGRYFDK